MIIGQTVKLRAPDWGDMADIVEWRNDPDVYRWFFEYVPQSLTEQHAWFESYLERDDENLFMIVTLDDHPLGTIGLTHIDLRNRKAYLGRFYIGSKKDRAKPYGPEAEWLLLQYCFEHLNLNRVYVEVFAFNRTVVKLHKTFGFQVEGKLREEIFREGKYEDVVVMGLLREEYERVHPGISERLGRLFEWAVSV